MRVKKCLLSYQMYTMYYFSQQDTMVAMENTSLSISEQFTSVVQDVHIKQIQQHYQELATNG